MISRYLILVVFFAVTFFTFISFSARRDIERHKIPNSRAECSRMGCNIALIGATGDGKSTTAAGITCYLIEHIIYELQQRMEAIRIKLDHVDFNDVIKIFENNLEKHLPNLEKSCLETVIYFCPDVKMDSFSIDFLNQDLKPQLLFKYLMYYFRLIIDTRYVYSKGFFFDRVTCQNSKLWDSSSIELRNVLKNRNFQINICDIIYDDEKPMERGNVKSNDKDVKLSGSKEFYMLIRNMFENLTYHIVMKQISSDEVKVERNLINSSLQIFDRKDMICSFPILRSFLTIVEKFLFLPIYVILFFKGLFCKRDCIKEFKNSSHGFSSFCRKIERFFKYCKDLLISTSFIRVRLFKYYSSEDVGRRTKGTYDCIVLFFPVYYCYGLVNTYEYRDIAFPIFDKMREAAIDEATSKNLLTGRQEQVLKIFMEDND